MFKKGFENNDNEQVRIKNVYSQLTLLYVQKLTRNLQLQYKKSC